MVKKLTHNGITDSLTGWAWRTGLSISCLKGRLKSGWTISRALVTEARQCRRTGYDSDGRKICPGCSQPRHADDYYQLASGKKHSYCRDCNRNMNYQALCRRKKMTVYAVIVKDQVINTAITWRMAYDMSKCHPKARVVESRLHYQL